MQLKKYVARICSLIICEGISGRKNQVSDTVNVPSLYVRVYRPDVAFAVLRFCSLIICEGISI